MMKLLLVLSILIILLFLGMFYYRSCKKTADEFVREIIEEKDEIKKKDNLERKSNLN